MKNNQYTHLANETRSNDDAGDDANIKRIMDDDLRVQFVNQTRENDLGSVSLIRLPMSSCWKVESE